MKRKIKKKYLVNIDLEWSQDYNITAYSMPEAKKLAWEKFINDPPKKDFKISADKID